MDTKQLKKDYDKYWGCEEINIDLANKLVNQIPKLLREIEELNNLINSHGPEGRNYTNRQYVLMQQEAVRLRKVLEKVTSLGTGYAKELAYKALEESE